MRYRSLKSKKIYNEGYDAGREDERKYIIELIQQEFIHGSRSTLISLIELLQAEMIMRRAEEPKVVHLRSPRVRKDSV